MERWSLALEEMRQLKIVDKEYEYTLEYHKGFFVILKFKFSDYSVFHPAV